mmetsp:Transcript_10747/g.23639  ORF Transcript_10747/g.23639 Transcript_10747/m.23639 type:complete len:204 (+) Transcript_10747:120-731(+)
MILQLVRSSSPWLDNLLPPSLLIGAWLCRIMIYIFIIKLIIVISLFFQVSSSCTLLLSSILLIPIGIFHNKLSSSALFILVHPMMLYSPLWSLDASESNISSSCSTMQSCTSSKSCSMIKVSIQTIDIASASDDTCLVLATSHPLPYISCHIIQPQCIWLERFDRTRGSPSILCEIFPWESTCTPQIGILFRHIDSLLLTPNE